MQVDEIKRKIDILNSYIEEIRPTATLSVADFSNDKDKVRVLERLFQLIVDETVDINTLILSDTFSESPETYRSTFYAVSKLGIIETHFADTIALSAKLRNQIVHQYDKVQEKVMIEDIKKFIPLFEKYVAIIIEKFIQPK